MKVLAENLFAVVALVFSAALLVHVITKPDPVCPGTQTIVVKHVYPGGRR